MAACSIPLLTHMYLLSSHYGQAPAQHWRGVGSMAGSPAKRTVTIVARCCLVTECAKQIGLVMLEMLSPSPQWRAMTILYQPVPDGSLIICEGGHVRCSDAAGGPLAIHDWVPHLQMPTQSRDNTPGLHPVQLSWARWQDHAFPLP